MIPNLLRPALLVAGVFALSACGNKDAAMALSAARDANSAACESARATRAQAFANVDQADAALIAAQDAVAAASKDGQRPRNATKAVLYDQAADNLETAKDRLQQAKRQADEAARAEETACTGG